MRQKIILAFSGGSDSAFLLDVIYRLTNQKVHAVFFKTPFVSPVTLASVSRFLKVEGVNHTILPVDLMKNPDVVANRPDRCYHCKRHMFETLFNYFGNSIDSLRFMEGTNLSEVLEEQRSGLAAIEELGVESPLRLSGITEEDIAALRQEHAMTGVIDDVGCLATRIPYGTQITKESLERIDMAEDFLRKQGFHHVRARFFGEKTRIEVNMGQLNQLKKRSLRKAYKSYLETLGFYHVLIDNKGYQKGNLGITSSRV